MLVRLVVLVLTLTPALAGADAASIPEVSEPTEDQSPPRAGRIVGEVLVGGVGEVAVGLLGVYGAALAGEWSLFDGASTTGITLAASGVGLGAALAVWGAGELRDGDGSLLATLGGSAAGTLAVVAIDSLDLERGQAWIQVTATLGLPLLGAVLAYELTQEERSSGQASASLSVAPVVVALPDGGTLGLVGVF